MASGRVKFNTKEKVRCFSMALEKKRKLYKCNNFKTLDVITPWSQYARVNNIESTSSHYKFKPKFNEKVSIFVGDITTLEIDAIVNSTDKQLISLGEGGSVAFAIHLAAGPGLRQECRHLKSCYIGNSKISGGYQLPAKFVIHTVGPVVENPSQLQSCYQTCLGLFRQYELKSIAFPCISTGKSNYPNEKAAEIALKTVRHWLDISRAINKIDRIIFCLFQQKDVDIYHKLMPIYFPLK